MGSEMCIRDSAENELNAFSAKKYAFNLVQAKMTCAENPPPSSLKQDGLCIHGLYCSNQSSGVEQRAGMCENVSASWFDTLKKRDEKKLPLDWKMAMLNIGSSF